MKAASLSEIKKELKSRDSVETLELCLRLGRFKKDNKELLTYLLFEARDEQAFISSIKIEIDGYMEGLNVSNLYYAKKGLRKILRNLNKNIRYSGNKQTEVELLLHFCQVLKKSSIDISRSVQLTNLYDRQIQKIMKALTGLHEDLQADYQYELEKL
ncbi:MAG: hypothetical protein GY816_18925 [Cytophagales bacterium]|nr:hypothetical protein [Cytophagales bacterium]